jgi:hypothetical protein
MRLSCAGYKVLVNVPGGGDAAWYFWDSGRLTLCPQNQFSCLVGYSCRGSGGSLALRELMSAKPQTNGSVCCRTSNPDSLQSVPNEWNLPQSLLLLTGSLSL